MELKNILKNLKLNENNVSMLLGAAVIIVVGFLIVNYFKNINQGTTTETSTSTTTTQEQETKLPTKHTVKQGESLWSIAQEYYNSGYNWVDIQKANNLSDASHISIGQVLTIPDVAPKVLAKNTTSSPTATETGTIAIASPTPMAVQTPSPKPQISQNAATTQDLSQATSYTVSHGDNLWKIAVKAYADGFQWKKIAQANKLKNPRVIHSGNVLILPR